jgi:hypothetical protein
MDHQERFFLWVWIIGVIVNAKLPLIILQEVFPSQFILSLHNVSSFQFSFFRKTKLFTVFIFDSEKSRLLWGLYEESLYQTWINILVIKL